MYEDKLPIEDFLMHYGKGHLDGGHSGRYPWGSGEHRFQRTETFVSRFKQLEADKSFVFIDKQGKWGPKGKAYTGQVGVAHYMGLSSDAYRTQRSLAINELRNADYIRAKALYDAGYGYTEIARKMGWPNESTARSKLDEYSNMRTLRSQEVADVLRDAIDQKLAEDPKAMIDIGEGMEKEIAEKLGYPVSSEKLKEAVYILEREGYQTAGGRLPNVTDPTGKRQTTQNVLMGPDASKGQVYDIEHIYTINDYFKDGQDTLKKNFEYPASLDSSRVGIRYDGEGGELKDGVIELRRGVPDISLGDKSYAQVRIMVDGTHYLKGMAIYSDDIPDGVDVMFNTKKKQGTPLTDVLKEIKNDPDNPFGSNIKEKDGEIVGQTHYIGADGKEHLGVVNRTRDEGDWNNWKDDLSAQFLSKQSMSLINQQLGKAIKDKQDEYNDILKCENPTLRKELLDTFASDCDSAAVHLTAASLPRQKYQVILPINSLKDDEIYATNFNDGEEVALIRYPHGGIFEIPVLKVNNKNKEGVKTLGKNSEDCVGINHATAMQLSGADFDGDTVMVIPISAKSKIKSMKPLKDLKNFDTDEYTYAKVVEDKSGKKHYFNAAGNEYKIMDESEKQKQMGIVSNLITDMTLKGANFDEIAQVTKHSMVVIDAPKHKLDYKTSEAVNEIDKYKEKYQSQINEKGNKVHGASTLISKAKSEQRIPKTQGTPRVNIEGKPWYDETKPEGSLVYKTADNLYYVKVKVKVKTTDSNGKTKTQWVNAYDDKSKGDDKYNNSTIDIVSDKIKKGKYAYNIDNPNGKYKHKDGTRYDKVTVKKEEIKILQKQDKSTKMAQTNDARSLISSYNTQQEQAYATFANTMKSLANEARKVSYFTQGTKQNKAAKQTYAKEIQSLTMKLDLSEKNAPRERAAQRLATIRVKAKKASNPKLANDKEQLKKTNQQELLRARNQVGAQRKTIDITDREWEAILSGAFSDAKLRSIFAHTDGDKLKERAIPRDKKNVTDSMVLRMQSLRASGHTNAEIAATMGISAASVSKYLNE